MKRLIWIDISKGLAILVVAYFHFFRTYFQYGVLLPPDWSNLAASALTILRLVWFKVSGLGFHAVGVFIILSGWTLMQSTMRRVESGPLAWGGWYRARFLRLYPMYWVAHLVYLVSPFMARLEPVDDRIVLSLLGLRFIDIQMNFMLDVSDNRVRCRIFRALHITRALAAKRIVGAWRFRGLSLARVCARNVVRNVAPPISRARRMVSSSRRRFRSWTNPVSRGAAALPRPLRLHFGRFRHWRVLHARNRRHRRSHLTIQQSGETVRTGRTLFLRLVSDSPTLCHLAGTSHSRGADLVVSSDRSCNTGYPKRVGNAFGKIDQRAGEQIPLVEKTSARLASHLLLLFQ